MINIIIWFASFLCPNPSHTIQDHGNCHLVHCTTTSNLEGDTGGETGGGPKPPVTPPPPPPGGGG